ncbi:MAG: uroporphyrinogen decarboxylase family protein [Candidatus Geothermarchaeales archaeon]
MSHRERYMTAVRLEEPDVVPVDLSLDLVHVERITGRKTLGVSLYVGKTQNEVEMDMNEVMMGNLEARVEAARRLDLDAIIVRDSWFYPQNFKPRFIDENTYVDHYGKIYRIRRDVKTRWWIGGIIGSPEDLDEYVPPDPDEMCYDVLEAAIELAGEEYPVVGWSHCGMMMPWQIRGGLDKLVHDIYRDPGFAKKLIKTIADVNIGVAKNMLDRGVDVLAESDDIADAKSTFFPPRVLREFFFPHMERLIQECHRRDVPFMKHSDGNLYPVLDDMISLGIDGLHPIEPGVMDLADVKGRYGDRVFLRGNVDCTHILPYGREADVRRDVRRCIDAAARGGGFILSDSNSCHANCTTENILTLVDEARRYGRYPRG